MPEIYYIESSYGCEDDACLEIRWNSTRIIVNLLRNPAPNTSGNSLIDKQFLTSELGDEDAYTDAQDAILDAAVAVGAAEFDRLAPPPPEPLRQLHAILFPQQYTFRLVTVSGELKFLLEGTYLPEVRKNPAMGFINVVSHPNPPSQLSEQLNLSIRLEIDDTIKLPRYSTQDIEVLEKLLGDGYISHVRVDGHEMCAKVGREGREKPMQRELNCLQKVSLHCSKEPHQINIPKLLGLICMPNDKTTLIGILEELVSTNEDQELSSLGHIGDMLAIPISRRQAWANQVRQTVDWLHERDILWGDGKADNVLIHSQTNETWLIDFGGGFTVGWVDQQVEEIVEGDEQAVRKIVKYLM